MKIREIGVLLVTVLVFSLSITIVSAQSYWPFLAVDEVEIVHPDDAVLPLSAVETIDFTLDEVEIVYPDDAAVLPLFVAEVDDTENFSLNSMVVPVAPMSTAPITEIFISHVCSEKAKGCEYIEWGQTSTKKDHGGSWIELVSWEIGFGDSVARFQNTTIVPGSPWLLETVPMCRLNSTTYTVNCAGKTILGYRKIWNVRPIMKVGFGTGLLVAERYNNPVNNYIGDSVWVYEAR